MTKAVARGCKYVSTSFEWMTIRQIGAAALLAIVAVPSLLSTKATAQEWQSALASYAWFAGLRGQMRPGAGNSSEFHSRFYETADNVSLWPLPAMLVGELRAGRLSISTDFLVMEVKNGLDTSGILFSGSNLTMRSLEWTVSSYYRVVDNNPLNVDIGGGFRLRVLTTKTRIQLGQLPATSLTISEAFADPIVAMRTAIAVTDRWSIDLKADVGGFDISSKLTWQAMGTVNYHMGRWTQLRVGWRYLAVTREKVDVTLSGPILGTSFRF